MWTTITRTASATLSSISATPTSVCAAAPPAHGFCLPVIEQIRSGVTSLFLVILALVGVKYPRNPKVRFGLALASGVGITTLDGMAIHCVIIDHWPSVIRFFAAFTAMVVELLRDFLEIRAERKAAGCAAKRLEEQRGVESVELAVLGAHTTGLRPHAAAATRRVVSDPN
ncbi:unnamed protein product [Zymoseptoria tritici ST99CH_3D7]|uniref:Uncharacterized protein n=2 Tax=Zymoseptoria tritici TaxID=1047171 RepID=A0A1X7S730_ZYMT9|nr:unnamed protein product [Zymoseptoria tritici ST99CH_3D7]SMR60698.1 unnamed protein product [Zymoseptoria tritici ST99CH_1E4]